MSVTLDVLIGPKNGIIPDGVKNGINTEFTLPVKFTQDEDLKIIFLRNGQEQALGFDYIVDESGGPGTGYDTIIVRRPPRVFDFLICHIFQDD